MDAGKNIRKTVARSRAMFDAYNPDVWIKHKFYDGTGGYVVIHRRRMELSRKSQNEKDKFKIELAMSEVFARNGHRIEMLEEDPRRRSYDVNFDGIPTDLKLVHSIKGTVRSAAKAVKKQHAKFVLFQFEKYDPKLNGEIRSLVSKDIHGMYYINGGNVDIFSW